MCKGSQSSDKVQVADVIREALSPDLCRGRHRRGVSAGCSARPVTSLRRFGTMGWW